jgi:hypothetical protein
MCSIFDLAVAEIRVQGTIAGTIAGTNAGTIADTPLI